VFLSQADSKEALNDGQCLFELQVSAAMDKHTQEAINSVNLLTDSTNFSRNHTLFNQLLCEFISFLFCINKLFCSFIIARDLLDAV
jgi:hypothetical protein